MGQIYLEREFLSDSIQIHRQASDERLFSVAFCTA